MKCTDLKKTDKARLLGESIIVEQLSPEEVTSGGIVLPDSARALQPAGKVLKVGEGCTTVKPGETVLYLPESSIEVPALGENIFLINARDIILIYPEE